MSVSDNKKLDLNNKEDDEPDTFFQYFFNPKRGTVFGRSGADCFRLTVFYIILYIILAAFWMLMLLIFYQTLDERVPKYTLDESRIGSNPGLGFRPRPKNEQVDSTLIWFKNGANEGSWRYWSNSLEKFLEPYQKATDQTGAHIQKCSGPQGWASEGKFCFFDIKGIDNNCTKQNEFGYRRGDPCVLLKLNRIFNWRPEPFSSEDLTTNKNIPESVRKQYPTRSDASQLIYITCEGEVCFEYLFYCSILYLTMFLYFHRTLLTKKPSVRWITTLLRASKCATSLTATSLVISHLLSLSISPNQHQACLSTSSARHGPRTLSSIEWSEREVYTLSFSWMDTKNIKIVSTKRLLFYKFDYFQLISA